MASFKLKSLEFRREREATWRELESLVSAIEKGGLHSLTDNELSRLPILYRAVVSSLSVARSISLDRALLQYLEALAGRAYFCVYGTRRDVFETIDRFFRQRFPAAVRQFRWYVALAAAVLLLGAATGLIMTLNEPDRFYSFVDSSYAQGRDPSASTETLLDGLYDTERSFGDQLIAFASFLFSHNARIGMLCFALGFAFGLPTLILLFTNGLIIGAFAGLFHSRSIGVDFWGWVLPHGVTELLAVVLCGAAGMVLGHSLLVPGRATRLQNLARRGREAGMVVLGAVVMFFVAALIEGIFRQTVTDISVRYSVIAVTALFWLLFFSLVGRFGVTKSGGDGGG